jgi:hypothetical protein
MMYYYAQPLLHVVVVVMMHQDGRHTSARSITQATSNGVVGWLCISSNNKQAVA